MPTVKLEEKAPLLYTLEIRIEPADYQRDFNKEIKKIAAENSFRGFRRGKTPIPFLKKMYGQELLPKIIAQSANEAIENYFQKNKEFPLLGDPVAAEDQEKFEVFPTQPHTYTLKFEVAAKPEFELPELSSKKEFNYYTVHVEEDRAIEILEEWRLNKGTKQPTEEPISDGFVVTLHLHELDDSGQPIEGKEYDNIELDVDPDQFTKEFYDTLVGKQTGDVFTFDPLKVFEELTPQEFATDILGINEEELDHISDNFQFRIVEVGDIIPAPLDKEFFDKIFPGGKITSEAEAIKTILVDLQNERCGKSRNLALFHEMKDYFIEQLRDKMPLPEDYLLRLEKIENESNYSEIEKDTQSFFDDLRWHLIKEKIAESYGLTVTSQELENKIIARFLKWTGDGVASEQMRAAAQRILRSEDNYLSLHYELLDSRILQLLKEKFSLKEVVLSDNEHSAKIQAILKIAPDEVAEPEIEAESANEFSAGETANAQEGNQLLEHKEEE